MVRGGRLKCGISAHVLCAVLPLAAFPVFAAPVHAFADENHTASDSAAQETTSSLINDKLAALAPTQNATAFAIRGGALSEALAEFAAQSGAQILYRADAIEGRTTAALNGVYSPREAMARLLAGTELRARWDGGQAVAVFARADQTLGVANASEGGAAALASPYKDVVVAVGSRRSGRGAAQSPSSIMVVSADALSVHSGSDLSNVLRAQLPSYNVSTQPIADASTFVRPVNIRGFSPDAILTLVNNKRRHRSAVITFFGGGINDGAHGPDISVIPAIALKQVEVLQDGAASQYGSDAIAGVLNFELKDTDDGAEFVGEWGQTYQGDGARYRLAANVGAPLKLAQGGFVNLSAEFSQNDSTSRSVQRGDAAALIAAGNTAVADPAQIWGEPQMRDNIKLFGNSAIGLSDNVELYAFGNYAHRKASGGFYFRNPLNRSGVFSNDDGASLLVGDLTVDGSGNCPAIPITDLRPDQTALDQVINDPDCFVFNELFPGGFTPTFSGTVSDNSLVAGLRGVIGAGLHYDVSFTRGHSGIDFFLSDSVNASLGPQSPTSFSPGGFVQSDRNFNVDLSYALPTALFASDLNLALGFEHRRERFTASEGDEASYIVGPLAAPSSAFPAGQGFSSSANGFGGITPAAATISAQRNWAVYGEAEADITPRLLLQAAVRHEDFYTSFGSTTNYKIGGLYRLSDRISLRATRSTGFHAPTAGQASVTNVTTAFDGSNLVDRGTVPLQSGAGQFIASRIEADTGVRPTLTPEKSRSLSFGWSFAGDNIRADLNYYRIRVDDRISISDNQDFVGALRMFAGEEGVLVPVDATTSQILNLLDSAGALDRASFAGAEDLSSFRFFTNSFDTRTQGIDFSFTGEVARKQAGTTNVTTSLSWTDTRVSDAGRDTAAPLLTGRERQIEDSTPSVRGYLQLDHQRGRMRALGRVNYWGRYFSCHLDSLDLDGECALPFDGGAQVTFDLEARVALSTNVAVEVGAQNLFDSTPDALPGAFSQIAGAQFPENAPGGFNGGSYYLRVRSSF